MPATPAEPPRRTARRDQRRSWSALDTPHGFERCVRATLRELYGYVALLTGRDRREAERIVGDVYRSLFRAATVGDAESVTLGALRSAARRAWLDEHRIELATTDEVSRAAASTIAELSPLERAVLVLRHVNGMSTERAALELGRGEREVAAVGGHAVRRLRGTDDTSGTWLRAYLGPTVTPAAGLVDRIVQQLGDPGDPPIDEVGDGPDPVPDAVPDAVPDPVPDAVPGGPDASGDDVEGTARDPHVDARGPEPVGPDDAVGTGDAAAGPETTELAIVDRPTVEVPTIAAPGAAAGTEPQGAGSELPPTSAPDAAPVGMVEQGRPRWALVIGAILIVALVVALVWLALRGDPADTVVSTPDGSAPVAAATDVTGREETGTEETGTDVAVSEGAATDAPATADTATAADPGAATATRDGVDPLTAGPVELGFDPVCVDRSGSEPAAVPWTDAFGPLGDDPALTISLPESVDATADPDRAPPQLDTVLRPDGLIVNVRPADGHAAATSFVARVGLDGTIAWVRCFDAVVRIAASPDAGIDLAVRPVAEGGSWVRLSLTDGSDGDALDAVQAEVLDRPAAAERKEGPLLGYSYDSDLARSVLAGLDDGTVVWTAPDVVLPAPGAFRAVQVDDTALAQSCGGTPSGGDCATGDLRGYDLGSGELLWSRAGVHRVVAAGDGVALVGDGTEWELVDVRTGDGVASQRWDARTFDVGQDDAVGFALRDGGALVVAQPGSVAVWLPRDTPIDTSGGSDDVTIP